MEYRPKIQLSLFFYVVFVLVLVQAPVFAKSVKNSITQRYIVILEDLPLAAYDGRVMLTPERDSSSTRLPATANFFTGAHKLDVRAPRSKQYLQFLDDRLQSFSGEAALVLGRKLQLTHRYRNATNGFATELSAAEVRSLRGMAQVKAVLVDETQRLETDSGPAWIGAKPVHNGSAGFAASGGEGVVVGVIDSGVNWDHPSFADPGEGFQPPGSTAWNHVNPYPSQLGLCSDPEVLCNDKLVGVYDFVQDDPQTDITEENTKGKDNAGHGSHVTSTAAGNPVNLFLSGIASQIGGVAPNANIVMYRVCYIADPDDPDDDACQNSAILSAIDQAITDGVDVINYSIGSDASNPWSAGSAARAFLNARAAGIFVATSAGNSGPNASSIGSPANAPWITAAGAASHDRVIGNTLKNMTGGDTTPPADLLGASLTGGISARKIVYAGDFGNALCGTGVPELMPDCAGNTGATNPFAPGTFNGEIVMCDRGEYGRVEKGKNLLLAGAGGYVLANTQATGETITPDNHCLPATHIGAKDGDKLRNWLASGSNHMGVISGFSIMHVATAGDRLASFSSRGPNLPPVADVLKPDVIAPGADILAASDESVNSFAFLSGTSMASPHVAGGAALIKSVHPEWTPAMLNSVLAMTATPELALDFDGTSATPHKRGSGRPRLDQAVGAGLYLDETEAGFLAANPAQGGDPKNLNLPGLVDGQCLIACNFQRTVTDAVGGADWLATAAGFPDGVVVSITPENFTLANGASRLLSIDVDLTQAGKVGSWVYGEVRLSSAGLPDAVFTVAVFAHGGDLPTEWQINSDQNSGWQEFTLENLTAMPDATFQTGGLVVPTQTVEDLVQDPTNDTPYDGGAGVMTLWHSVAADTLWLHTETLASTATDLDLFVGLDANGDGVAQANEELCRSTSPNELELCDLFTPQPGEYWVIVQNWAGLNNPDTVTLVSAVVGKNTLSRLTATGTGIVAAGGTQTVRLSWDNVNARRDTELIGAVGIGSSRESPNDIGIIPVKFTKTAVGAVETLVLMDGITRGVLLNALGTHDRAYIDIPPGTASLTVTASGADDKQSDALEIQLFRMDFDNAFSDAPFATAPDTSGSPLASATGGAGIGPTVTVSGAALQPGRWYVVLISSRGVHAPVEIRADITATGGPMPLQGGLWEPSSRPGIKQGFDFAKVGGSRGFIWYTYDENGNSTWYLAADVEPQGNAWVAELTRYTNDGALQQATSVGFVSITQIGEQDLIFSFVLFGQEGSDRMRPSSPPICPTIANAKLSFTGLWGRLLAGLGGASVLVNGTSQGHLHYIYDSSGNPRWILGADGTDGLPTAREVTMEQFSGYCAVCAPKPLSNVPIGLLTRDFADESNVTWTLDYVLNPPLSGSVTRTDDAVKFTELLICQ